MGIMSLKYSYRADLYYILNAADETLLNWAASQAISFNFRSRRQNIVDVVLKEVRERIQLIWQFFTD